MGLEAWNASLGASCLEILFDGVLGVRGVGMYSSIG